MPLGMVKNFFLLSEGGAKKFASQQTEAFSLTGGDEIYLFQDSVENKTYRVHEFHSTGTTGKIEFSQSGIVEYLVVAGGGGGAGGGFAGAGGGGAGGATYDSMFVSIGEIEVKVGAGGTRGGSNYTQAAANGQKGGNSSFGDILVEGGGGGGTVYVAGRTGGSGGGGGGNCGGATNNGGAGIPGKGHDGSKNRAPMQAGVNCANGRGGNGGGAGGPGEIWGLINDNGIRHGGIGIEWPTGSGNWYAGGGGGSMETGTHYGRGGTGGGGNASTSSLAAQNGVARTGGGGGGGKASKIGGNGGSGIVLVRYPIDSSTIWDPSGMTGMQFWYDMNQQDSQSDDTEITTLTDFSGNGRDLTAYGTVKPKYRTNLLNGLPGVRFTGSGLFWTQNWQSGNWPLFHDPVTLVIVSKMVNQTFAFQSQIAPTISSFGVFGTRIQYFNAWGSNRYMFGLNGSNYPVQSYTNTPSTGTDAIVVSTKDNTGITSMRGNGSNCTAGSYFPNASGGTPISDLHGSIPNTARYIGMTIGGTVNNPQTPTFVFANNSTYFYETLHFDRVLSSGEMEKLEGYLAHKWKLTSRLPQNHPYKQEPPYV